MGDEFGLVPVLRGDYIGGGVGVKEGGVARAAALAQPDQTGPSC